MQLIILNRAKNEHCTVVLSIGIIDLISEDPPTVRLRFDPSGKPNKDREYYLTEKENVCVVCGNQESYIRKNVIPHEYRKYALLYMYTSH